MIGLLQRVRSASVEINNTPVARIERGILVLVAVENGDGPGEADRLAERLCGYRVFSDDEGKMNLSVTAIRGGILLVPQFTLAADTGKGTRPSFHPAAEPETGKRLFNVLAGRVAARGLQPQTGEFGADMQVSLINDGPVTFWLRVKPAA